MGRRLTLNSLNAAALAAALTFCLPAAAQTDYSIRWVPDPKDTNKVAIEVTGLSSSRLAQLLRAQWTSEQWQKLLSVSVDQDDFTTQLFLPPMVGSYRAAEKALRFDPQFPLQPGIRYRAVFRPGELTLTSTFTLPATRPLATTVVTRIFPSADVLPENLL